MSVHVIDAPGAKVVADPIAVHPAAVDCAGVYFSGWFSQEIHFVVVDDMVFHSEIAPTVIAGDVVIGSITGTT